MVVSGIVRIAIAFLVAPIFAVFIIPVGICVPSLLGSGSCDVDFGWTPVFLTIAYGATIIAGVPLYLGLTRFGVRRWWQYGLVGVVVGLVAAVIANVMDPGFVWYRMGLLCAPIGFVSGILEFGAGSQLRRFGHQG